MDTMKKTLISLACTLALALGATAQTVTFAQLPSVRTPSVLPNGYASLDWSGFYYVSPSWVGADAGLRQGPSALNVAFMGGASCELNDISCSASISSAGATAAEGFIVHSAIVAAGSHAETINVSAYNHGHFVGAEVYSLTASLQTISFPPGWGTITQLVVDTDHATVVLYAVSLDLVGASAGEDVAASAASHQGIGSTAPLGIVDPPPPLDLPTQVKPPIIVIGTNAHNGVGATDGGGMAQPDDLIYKQDPNITGPAQPVNALPRVQPD
jgi:hypothetical protein